MIIGAIDPGYGTGYAVYNVELHAFHSWETYGGVLELEMFELADVIICESYTITAKTAEYTQQTDALRHIGAIETFCKMNDIELVMQQPSAKRFAKPNKLKLLGWANKTKDSHADDAAAHLLNYLVKNRLLRADEMKAIKGALK